MRTVQDYIELAKPNAIRPSDNGVAQTIGIQPSALNRLKKGWSTPSEGTTLALAELAHIPAAEALMDRLQWKSDNPTAKKIYERLAQVVSTAALSLLLLFPGGEAQARTHAEQTALVNGQHIYYANIDHVKVTLCLSSHLCSIAQERSVYSGHILFSSFSSRLRRRCRT